MSYDAWKTTNPADERLGRAHGRTDEGPAYVCRDCAWRDRGGVNAMQHHILTAHRVRGRDWPTSWPDSQFSCCVGGHAKRQAG